MNAIEANGITKSFSMGKQSVPVLGGIDLAVAEGEFVSLMDPSGSGKSTLLYILGGLDKADAGTVTVGGKEITHLGDRAESVMRRREIGFVFQSYNLIDNLTVEENILLPALLDGKRKRELLPWLSELLAATGLEDRRGHRPAELSGGQQQRTAIARALISRPKVLFADEPIGNLDSKNGEAILSLLARLNREYGTTVLMVTHAESSARYGSRIIQMVDGRMEGVV